MKRKDMERWDPRLAIREIQELVILLIARYEQHDHAVMIEISWGLVKSSWKRIAQRFTDLEKTGAPKLLPSLEKGLDTVAELLKKKWDSSVVEDVFAESPRIGTAINMLSQRFEDPNMGVCAGLYGLVRYYDTPLAIKFRATLIVGAIVRATRQDPSMILEKALLDIALFILGEVSDPALFESDAVGPAEFYVEACWHLAEAECGELSREFDEAIGKLIASGHGLQSSLSIDDPDLAKLLTLATQIAGQR